MSILLSNNKGSEANPRKLYEQRQSARGFPAVRQLDPLLVK